MMKNLLIIFLFFVNSAFTQDFYFSKTFGGEFSNAPYKKVVLLKSKDGKSIETIFEKPGTKPATYSDYKSSDIFDESPTQNSSGQSVIHSKKREK